MLGKLIPISIRIKWKSIFFMLLLGVPVLVYVFGKRFYHKFRGVNVKQEEYVSQTKESDDTASDVDLPTAVYVVQFEIKGLGTGGDVISVGVDGDWYIQGKVLLDSDEWEMVRFATKDLTSPPSMITIENKMPDGNIAINKSLLVNGVEQYDLQHMSWSPKCNFTENGEFIGQGQCVFQLQHDS